MTVFFVISALRGISLASTTKRRKGQGGDELDECESVFENGEEEDVVDVVVDINTAEAIVGGNGK